MENNKRKIYVIGHKNPDTDSICSAIAYADIKNRTEENPVYEAKRAGQINEETLYVLKRFQMNTPGYMPNVGTRVKDMDVRKVGGVDSKISLKKAWTLMRNENVFTLPILNQNQELEGLITTNDITESYMDVYNNRDGGKLYHCLYGCSDFEDDPPTGRGERMFCDQFSA